MLFEIYTQRVYEETCCDPEHGIKSERVPHVEITESDYKVRELYSCALDMLHRIIDKCRLHHLLEIDMIPEDNTPSITIPAPSKTYKYTFKFATAVGVSEVPIIINGKIELDESGNLVEFSKTNYSEKSEITPGTMYQGLDPRIQTVPLNDLTGTGYPVDHPFTVRSQDGEESVVNRQTNDCEKEESTVVPPVELSGNSFEIDGTAIEVLNPRKKIGKVDDNTFVIDAAKQAKQDEFLKRVNIKISKSRAKNK